MITQRAALLGFVAFCFYLIAVVNVLEGYFYALSWAAVGIFAASLGLALLSLIGLSCQIEVRRARSAAALNGERNAGPTISVALTNLGTLNKTGTLLELRLKDRDNAISSHRFIIEAIPSGASINCDLPLYTLRRGVYVVHEARLIGSDVLGLFRVQKRIRLDNEVGLKITVGPAILRGDKAAGLGGGVVPASSRRTLRAGHGDELRGTRPYAPGDDLRHVHWKSSARFGELVVKEFEQTGRQASLVVWDGTQDTTWGSGDYDSTEWSLILCASLCRTILSGGTSCDFARMDDAPKFIEARALAGYDLPGPLNDAMAEATARRKTPLDVAIFELPAVARRQYSTVFLVTASLSPDVKKAASYWRNRGAVPHILLVDAPSLLAHSTERRFAGRGVRSRVQSTGDQAIAVTTQSFEAQLQSLREIAAHVVPVRSTGGSPAVDLGAAMRTIFDAHPTTMRAAERVSS